MRGMHLLVYTRVSIVYTCANQYTSIYRMYLCDGEADVDPPQAMRRAVRPPPRSSRACQPAWAACLSVWAACLSVWAGASMQLIEDRRQRAAHSK